MEDHESGEKLIPAKEALERCGYKSRNSLPALIKKLGKGPIKRDRLNYFFKSDVDRYLDSLASKATGKRKPTIYTTPSEHMLKHGEPEGGWPE